MSKSTLFTAYNAAKSTVCPDCNHLWTSHSSGGMCCGDDGETECYCVNFPRPACDRGRLNRALGIAQRKNRSSSYDTTDSTCSCPDFWYRRTRCKHIIALILKEVA